MSILHAATGNEPLIAHQSQSSSQNGKKGKTIRAFKAVAFNFIRHFLGTGLACIISPGLTGKAASQQGGGTGAGLLFF